MSKSVYSNDRTKIPAEIRREIEVEAGHACSIKGCGEHTYLEIHHIDRNRENNKKENLILLCDKHHKMSHHDTIDRKALIEYKKLLNNKRKRREPSWTDYLKIDAKLEFPLNAISVRVQYKLWSDDADIPLMIRISPESKGIFGQEESGPSGVVEFHVMEGQVYYVSVSDPDVKYTVHVVSYEF